MGGPGQVDRVGRLERSGLRPSRQSASREDAKEQAVDRHGGFGSMSGISSKRCGTGSRPSRGESDQSPNPVRCHANNWLQRWALGSAAATRRINQ